MLPRVPALCLVLGLPSCTADAGLAERAPVPAPDTYTVLADQRTVKLDVPVGGGCKDAGEATAEATETATEVRITVWLSPAEERDDDGVCTGDLIMQAVSVRLSSPLAERTVIDATSDKALRPRG